MRRGSRDDRPPPPLPSQLAERVQLPMCLPRLDCGMHVRTSEVLLAAVPACVAATRVLIISSRRKAVLYAVGCVADFVGAVFALSWKTYLSYEKIADYQATVMLTTTL